MPDLTAVKTALRSQRIELPSWAFGNTGTRFKVFAQPGVPRTPQEKIDDAAQVHKYTGVAPTVAVHIPWDKVDDYAAAQQRMAGTAVNERWQADMAPYFTELGGRRPDQGFRRINEIFHLD